MKKFFNYIPSISITFTLTILFTVLINLINGFEATLNIGILQIFLLVIMLHVITFIFSYLDFKSYKAYLTINFLSIYLASLFFIYIFNLIRFTLTSILNYTLVFCIIYYICYLFNKLNRKLESDIINKKISNP